MNIFLRVFLIIALTLPASLQPPRPQQSTGFDFSRLFSGSPPVGAADPYSTDEDIPLEIDAPGVLGNDTDPESDPLTAVLVGDVSHGILALMDDGSFAYYPDQDYAGPDSFTYTADDGTGQSNLVTVSITVDPLNDPPLGVDDNYSLNEDTVLNMNAAGGVLSNDDDVEDNSMTAVMVMDVSFGVLTFNSNGSFTYDPDQDFAGSDSFTYQASDGTDVSEEITVNLTVEAVNDIPVTTSDTYPTNEDAPINMPAPGVLANDDDVDGDTLTAVLVSNPSRGTLVLNADGSFLYTPNANISGSDSFTYNASDGQGVSTPATTVSIPITAVNDRPVAVNDSSYTVAEDGSLSVPASSGVLINDTDAENNPITAALVSGTTHGTLNLSATGSFTYTPALNYNGSDSFTYRANDGAIDSLNPATVTITVTSINDLPVAVDDSITTNEDTPITVPSRGVLANDTDIETDPLTTVLGTGPAHGTLNLNANGGYTYTPALNANGADSFTYFANDGSSNSLNPATVSITITPVNDAPTAANDFYTTAEDTTLTVTPTAGLLGNDNDVDNTSLTVALVAGPSSGSLTLNGDGSFSYTPSANFNGVDNFTYRAGDGTTQSPLPAATVTIEVTAVNDRPTVANDAYSTLEDTTLTVAAVGVLANDGDVDGNSITAQIVSQPAHGTVTLNANGSFTYTPALNYNGADSFTYRANDGSINSVNNATVNISIDADNDRPVTLNDAFTTAEDTTLNNAAFNVLANDSDVEGSPLTAQIAAQPLHGTVTLNSDGTFVYTPELNFSGSDSFTYRASDGNLTSTPPATVTITITAVNDLPTVGNDAFSTNEDTPLTVAAPGVLANDGDVEGSTLTAVTPTQPANGAVSVNADGAFTYTPALNFHGVDTFTYRANDGSGNSASAATVTITVTAVNDAPVGVNDTYTTSEDTTLAEFENSVIENDTDPEGSALTAQLASGPASGSLTLYENGTFTYTPATNFHGSVTFTYTTRDGSLSSLQPATVTINITAVNDAPVASSDTGTVTEDTALVVPAPGLLENDNDVDGDPLTGQVETMPAHGTLSLASDGGYSYTPAQDYDGSDSFTYHCNDGAADSAAVTVSLNFISVNDVPVATDDAYTTPEDTPLSVAAPGVLANDPDVDGDPLTAELVSGPAHGTLAIDPNGSFVYTPAANYEGTDSFTYQANDGTGVSVLAATVTITVEATNDAPQAADDTYSTAEDTPLTVDVPGVLDNDDDIDGDDITAVVGAQPAHGTLTLNANGSFTYTPALNYNGADSFTYYANDGTVNSLTAASVTLTVTTVNDVPVAVDDDDYSTTEDTALTVAAPGVLANDTDVEGDALTADLVAGPTHGTLVLNSNGSFTYTPALNYNGPDSFTYRANDGAGQSVLPAAVVSLTITPANDLPDAIDDTYATDEDTPLTVLVATGVLVNDTDEEGDALTAQVVAQPAHGTLTLNTDGSFTYTPALNYNGPDSFTYTASDATGPSEPATANITVNPVNDAPVAITDTYTAIDEDTVLSVPVATGVLANDTDVENDALTAQVVTPPEHGTLTFNADGSFTYTPALNYNGPDSFVYTASDGSDDSENTTVSLTVNPVNDAPVANAGTGTTPEDTALAVTLTASDVETPTQLTYVVIAQPAHGTLSGTAPALTYTPALNYNGPDSFTFQVIDPGALASTVTTVTLNITPVNDAPSALNDAYTTAEDNALPIALPGVLQNDTDIELSPLTAVTPTQPAHGTLALNANGSFTYTPALNYNGTDTFTYFANDGDLNSGAAATVTITITPVNDAPVAVTDSLVINEDTSTNLNTLGMLTNDRDVDGDALTPELMTNTAHGTVTLSAGVFTYLPELNYPGANATGVDSFTYRVRDGQYFSNTVTVNITVNQINDAPRTWPSGLADPIYTVAVDGVLEVSVDDGLMTEATDVEGQELVAQLVEGVDPTFGSVVLQPDGSFVFTASHWATTDQEFVFRACESTPLHGTGTPLCGEPVVVNIDITDAANTIELNWVSPVTNARRWRLGLEEVTLKVNITNCPDCGVRYYRWDSTMQNYVEMTTVYGDTSYTFSTSILQSGWGTPPDYTGWNQIIANAVLPEGGLASKRQYIWLIRFPYDGPATRFYIPLGAGK